MEAEDGEEEEEEWDLVDKDDGSDSPAPDVVDVEEEWELVEKDVGGSDSPAADLMDVEEEWDPVDKDVGGSDSPAADLMVLEEKLDLAVKDIIASDYSVPDPIHKIRPEPPVPPTSAGPVNDEDEPPATDAGDGRRPHQATATRESRGSRVTHGFTHDATLGIRRRESSCSSLRPVSFTLPHEAQYDAGLHGIPPKVMIGIMKNFDSLCTLKNITDAIPGTMKLIVDNHDSILAGIILNAIHPDNLDIAIICLDFFHLPWNALRATVKRMQKVARQCRGRGVLERLCGRPALMLLANMATDVNNLVDHYLAGAASFANPANYWRGLKWRYRDAWAPERRCRTHRQILESERSLCRQLAREFWSRRHAWRHGPGRLCHGTWRAKVQREFWKYELRCRSAMFCQLTFFQPSCLEDELRELSIYPYLELLTGVTLHTIAENSANSDDAHISLVLSTLRWEKILGLGTALWGPVVLEIGERLTLSHIWEWRALIDIVTHRFTRESPRDHEAQDVDDWFLPSQRPSCWRSKV